MTLLGLSLDIEDEYVGQVVHDPLELKPVGSKLSGEVADFLGQIVYKDRNPRMRAQRLPKL